VPFIEAFRRSDTLVILGSFFFFRHRGGHWGFVLLFFDPFGGTLYTSIRVCSASDILSFSSFLPSTPLQSRGELKNSPRNLLLSFQFPFDHLRCRGSFAIVM
jgi:hypothetical protein